MTEGREPDRGLFGEGPRTASRQMALMFALGLGLSLAGIPSVPGQRTALVVLAAVQAVLALLAWWLPWHRSDPRAPLVLSLPALVILALSTWAFGGSTAGTAPFYLLLAVWAGMHFSVRAVLALSPFVAASYLVPLFAVERGPMTLTGAVTFVPALVGVGVLIARQMEHQRRDRETIRRMERWRAALSATLAHDVRSPLTSVQFALETLDEEGELPAEQRHSIVSVALRQTGRIRRLAAGLLDADRLDSRGGLRLDLTTVPLRAAVEEAVGYLGTPVRVEVPDGLTVRADPQRLEQMLVNLTANAARHGAPPIVVSAAPDGRGMLAVHVRDHGAGVPEDKRPLLFSRFSSADTGGGSVGLGLWITRELARAHGGDASYAPADPGSRFTVTLPAG
ncbi:sensor histidine kinase [Planomonospora parontospora]|uniref:sensor histidine kinase n=1 Tax=Planomonospora parontospora TaxID=58119 RepID=UPI00177B644B|nr:HAMP domain-containing sensor histidine kinase [Planomonospora parontospora]